MRKVQGALWKAQGAAQMSVGREHCVGVWGALMEQVGSYLFGGEGLCFQVKPFPASPMGLTLIWPLLLSSWGGRDPWVYVSHSR